MIVAYLVVIAALMNHGSCAQICLDIDGTLSIPIHIDLHIDLDICVIGPPSCLTLVNMSCSSSATNDSAVVGDNITLRCDIGYSGEPPSFQWTDDRGNLITNATNTTTTGHMTSFVVIPAYFPYVPSVNFSATFPYRPTGENCTYIWTSPNTTVRCPDGFSSLPGSNTCYKIIFQPDYWNMASLRCQQLRNNSYLVMITSAAEQSAIVSYLSASITGFDCTVSAYYYYGNTIWTSYHRKYDSCDDTSSPFVWKPTSGLNFTGSYSGWGPGQPNCYDGNDYCMALLSDFGYNGFDVLCETPWCILCEYGPF